MQLYRLDQIMVEFGSKSAESAFSWHFQPKIDRNLGEIPLFSQMSRYLKNTFSLSTFARNGLQSLNLDQILLVGWEKNSNFENFANFSFFGRKKAKNDGK